MNPSTNQREHLETSLVASTFCPAQMLKFKLKPRVAKVGVLRRNTKASIASLAPPFNLNSKC